MSCETFPKRCNKCGRDHDAATWGELPCLGRNDIGIPDEPLIAEWRNCSCGSTLIIEVQS